MTQSQVKKGSGSRSKRERPATARQEKGASARRAPQARQLESQVARLEKEKKALEQEHVELKRLLETYMAHYRSAPVAYLILDKRGVIREANQACSRLLRVGLRKVALQPFSAFVDPSGRPVFRSFLRRVFASRSREVCELQLSAPGNGPVYVRAKGLVSESGKECRLVLTDITERKAIEEALRKSESFLRAAFDNAPFEFWARDTNEVCIMENAGIIQNWGSILGTKTEDSEVPPEALAVWKSNNRRAFAGEVVTGEIQYPGNTGPRWVFNVVAPFRIDGRIQGILGFNIDITQRKLAEQELAAAGERMRFQLAETPAMLYACKAQMPPSAVFVSDNVRTLLGYEPEDVTGDPGFWIKHVHPDDAAGAAVSLANVMQKGVNVWEYRLREKSGGYRWVRDHLRLIRDSEGNPAELVGCAIDITDRKRAEEALREAHSHLEQRVRERTAELQATNTALRESEARLRAAIDVAELGFYELRGEAMEVFADARMRSLLGAPEVGTGDLRQFWLGNVYPADRDRVLERSREVLENRLDHSFIDYRYNHPQRGLRWLHHVSNVLERNDQGRVTHLIGVMRDITDRKNYEQFLIAQRDMTQQLSAMASAETAANHLLEVTMQLNAAELGAVYLLDPEAKGLRLAAHRGFSPAFAERVRFCAAVSSPAEPGCSGQPMMDLPAELVEQYQKEGMHLLALIPLQQESRSMGVMVLAASRREEIPPAVLLCVRSLASQAAEAIVRIQTEIARGESERRFRALAEASFEGVIVSQDRRILDCNEQLTRILGYTREELIGSDLLLFVPPELKERTKRRIEEGQEVSAEHEILCNHGQRRVVEIRGRSPEGPRGPRLTAVRDVTERARLERQILEIGDRMQVNLGQELHDGLSQVLVSAAFDANALRQAVSGLGPEEHSTLERLCRALDNAITDARRLSRGLFPVKLEQQGLTTSLRHLTESVGQSAKLDSRFTEVRGPILISDNLVTIHLFRIAQEALNNAVKHARARKLEVRLTRGDDYLSLEVVDDGVGIAPKANSGTGLGLHIMQYRAHSLGATLQVNARPDGGTEVICHLPWPRTHTGPEAP